jgi:hypothetical protein
MWGCCFGVASSVQETQQTLQALSRHLQQHTPSYPPDQEQQQQRSEQLHESDSMQAAAQHSPGPNQLGAMPAESVQGALQQLALVLAGEMHVGLQLVHDQHWHAAAAAAVGGVAEADDLALAAYLDALLQQVG